VSVPVPVIEGERQRETEKAWQSAWAEASASASHESHNVCRCLVNTHVFSFLVA
jgi:hypothetical protein